MSKQSKQTKITILHIVPDERFGGPQGRVLQVAKHLKTEGFVTIVAMPEGDKTFANMLMDSDIPYYQVRNFRRLHPATNLGANLTWLLYSIPGTISLVRLIRRNKVDIVHVNGHLQLQGALAARLSGARLVWHLNGTSALKLTRILLLPFLVFLPHRLVVSARAVREHHFGSNSLASHATLLYPPVDTSKFRPDYNIEEYQHEFGLGLSDKVVGIIANINPTKGHEYFLQAAMIIKKNLPSTKFLVVGRRLKTAEKYWQRVKALITSSKLESAVILTGARLDTPQIMNVIDVFVLASLAEAAPVVVLEAMACGKPVVATNVGGVAELLVDGETGILVPPKDGRAIAEAVLYLLTHPSEARKMGLKGRERAIEYFDIKGCTQRHKDLYKEVLASAQPNYKQTGRTPRLTYQV